MLKNSQHATPPNNDKAAGRGDTEAAYESVCKCHLTETPEREQGALTPHEWALKIIDELPEFEECGSSPLAFALQYGRLDALINKLTAAIPSTEELIRALQRKMRLPKSLIRSRFNSRVKNRRAWAEDDPDKRVRMARENVENWPKESVRFRYEGGGNA